MTDTGQPQKNISPKPGVNWGNIFLAVSIILFVAVAGLIVYARYFQAPAADQVLETGDILGAQTPTPETNPFKANTNPLSSVYENPFK